MIWWMSSPSPKSSTGCRDEFIPTRSVREKQARSDGDKDAAAQIHELAKPNLVGWLANQLVREPFALRWPIRMPLTH